MKATSSETRNVTLLAVAAVLVVIAGCSVGPDYHQPAALKSEPVSGAFTVPAGTNNQTAEWKIAQPQAHLPRGAWWEIFNDSELNRLEATAATENQSLAAAIARLEESWADLGIAKADFFPQFSLTPNLN